MPSRIPPDVLGRIEDLLSRGYSQSETARRCGVHVNSVARLNKGRRHSGSLSPEALRGLEDFDYFRRRYIGRIATPWQAEAAYRMVELLASPDREYVVVNVAPGSGKSTLFTHDIPLWIATRNRAIRCMIGSASASIAKNYTRRLRNTFDREAPIKAREDMLALGLAVDAETTIAADYGLFKPANNDQWRIDEFVLAQHDGGRTEDKEPSFVAYGRDSGFLGGRFDLVIWDDLVTRGTMRTEDARAELIRWYEDEAETRIEPGGLFILQGQRMDSADLYRHALDMRGEVLDENDDPDNRPAKYHHIVYKAHYEEQCQDDHGKKAKAWPEGCLLDPQRLPYRFLAPLMRDKAEKFQVLYQQQDVDNSNNLVKQIWIDGGLDPDLGVEVPGCWDHDRQLGQFPDLHGEKHVIVTIDPSPSMYWACLLWVYHPESKLRYLVDIVRAKMDINEVLTRDEVTREFSGVLHDWMLRCNRTGNNLNTVIFEQNGAQKFFIANPAVQAWANQNFITLMPHTTSRNKSDPDYGVQMLGPLYRHGLIRLPRNGLQAVEKLRPMVYELTRWPEGRTEDTVMSHWFMETNLEHVAVPARIYQFKRPSWVKSA